MTSSSRTRRGKDFADALAYVNAVGALAEEMDHHPDIDIRWNTVTLRLSTHSAGGLTQLDLELARRDRRPARRRADPAVTPPARRGAGVPQLRYVPAELLDGRAPRHRGRRAAAGHGVHACRTGRARPPRWRCGTTSRPGSSCGPWPRPTRRPTASTVASIDHYDVDGVIALGAAVRRRPGRRARRAPGRGGPGG